MQLTEVKREDNEEIDITLRYNQMEDVGADGSKNSSDMQFSEVDENDEVHESRPYDNLLKRSNLIEPSLQDSPEREQSKLTSQYGSSQLKDLQESPQLALKKNKISLSTRKNHKSIDLQAKRKKNYTV